MFLPPFPSFYSLSALPISCHSSSCTCTLYRISAIHHSPMTHTRKITKKKKKNQHLVGHPTRAANMSAYLASLPNNYECPLVASDQIRSVPQSCLTLCDPMNPSTQGLPVHHQLPEFTETHVHRVNDAIQPSHPLSSPPPPATNPSQHQSLFQ